MTDLAVVSIAEYLFGMTDCQGAGRVASLHVHPREGGEAMRAVAFMDLVAEKGIVQDERYFGRRSRSGGPFKRQVTLMEREQIAEHAAVLGCESIQPGAVRANIETEGIDLVALIGRRVEVGSAELLIVEARTPCAQMDALVPGLRAAMENSRQGVIAQVVRSGRVAPGDAVRASESKTR